MEGAPPALLGARTTEHGPSRGARESPIHAGSRTVPAEGIGSHALSTPCSGGCREQSWRLRHFVVHLALHLRFRILGSGSSGNATLVEARGTRILLDAGLGPRTLAERLQDAGVDPEHLDGIFLSHEHHDHARGAAAFSRKWGVRLFGTRGTYAALGLGAEEIAGYDVIEAGTQRRIGSLTVTGVRVPHDAVGPLAFVVAADGVAFGHATDLGHVGPGLIESFKACDAVLIESNYDPGMLRDGPYPWSLKERILGPHGHLANADTARYLARGLGPSCRTVILGH